MLSSPFRGTGASGLRLASSIGHVIATPAMSLILINEAIESSGFVVFTALRMEDTQ
jgi:hypothetical protein